MELSDLVGHGGPVTLRVALLSLVLTFTLTQALAAVYMWTFQGMSYARSLVRLVGLGGLIACLLMLSLNNSIAAGIGIAGSLAFVRFRTALRDPHDLLFVFASMGAGIACGLRSYEVAIAGTAVFCAAAALFRATDFGRRERFDGLLRFDLPSGSAAEAAVADVLRAGTSFFAMSTLAEAGQGELVQYGYQVRLKDESARAALLAELARVPGIQGVSLVVQEASVEV